MHRRIVGRPRNAAEEQSCPFSSLDGGRAADVTLPLEPGRDDAQRPKCAARCRDLPARAHSKLRRNTPFYLTVDRSGRYKPSPSQSSAGNLSRDYVPRTSAGGHVTLARRWICFLLFVAYNLRSIDGAQEQAGTGRRERKSGERRRRRCHPPRSPDEGLLSSGPHFISVPLLFYFFRSPDSR